MIHIEILEIFAINTYCTMGHHWVRKYKCKYIYCYIFDECVFNTIVNARVNQYKLILKAVTQNRCWCTHYCLKCSGSLSYSVFNTRHKHSMSNVHHLRICSPYTHYNPQSTFRGWGSQCVLVERDNVIHRYESVLSSILCRSRRDLKHNFFNFMS